MRFVRQKFRNIFAFLLQIHDVQVNFLFIHGEIFNLIELYLKDCGSIFDIKCTSMCTSIFTYIGYRKTRFMYMQLCTSVLHFLYFVPCANFSPYDSSP